MPFSVLRLGIDARLDVDHVGAVRLTGDSPPARFAGQSWPRRRVLPTVADVWGRPVSGAEEEEQCNLVIF